MAITVNAALLLMKVCHFHGLSIFQVGWLNHQVITATSLGGDESLGMSKKNNEDLNDYTNLWMRMIVGN